MIVQGGTVEAEVGFDDVWVGVFEAVIRALVGALVEVLVGVLVDFPIFGFTIVGFFDFCRGEYFVFFC